MIGAGFVLSVLALAQLGLVPPLIATVLYAFLSIRLEDASILDFLRYAMCFLFLKQQYFEWRESEPYLSLCKEGSEIIQDNCQDLRHEVA